MSAAQKLYPVILQPAEFIHYQAVENHLPTTHNQIKTTEMKWAVYGFETFWNLVEFRDKRRFVLKECVTATAKNLLTLWHTVKPSTLQDVVLQCLSMMFYKADDVYFCSFSNLASVSRQQLWLLCQKGVPDCLTVQPNNILYMWLELLHTGFSSACLNESHKGWNKTDQRGFCVVKIRCSLVSVWSCHPMKLKILAKFETISQTEDPCKTRKIHLSWITWIHFCMLELFLFLLTSLTLLVLFYIHPVLRVIPQGNSVLYTNNTLILR